MAIFGAVEVSRTINEVGVRVRLFPPVLDLQYLVVLIGNFGFPVALSMYLLIRLEGKLETLTESIHSLSEALVRR